MAQVAQELEGVALPPAGKYELDMAHTSVGFVARHIFTKTRGRFTDFSGWIEIGERPEDSRTEVEIKTASISTDQEMRDGHLKSPDFLDVAKYPVMSFGSTGVHLGGTEFELDGELTIKDVTRPVTLVGEYLGVEKNPSGETVIAFTTKTTSDREDWDITWNMILETGGLLVGKKVDIELDVEAKLVG